MKIKALTSYLHNSISKKVSPLYFCTDLGKEIPPQTKLVFFPPNVYATEIRVAFTTEGENIYACNPIGGMSDSPQVAVDEDAVGYVPFVQNIPKIAFRHHSLGQTVNAFFQPLKSGEDFEITKNPPLAKPMAQFEDFDKKPNFVESGVKAIDILSPLGRGLDVAVLGKNQREKDNLIRRAAINLNRKKNFFTTFLDIAKTPGSTSNFYEKQSILMNAKIAKTAKKNKKISDRYRAVDIFASIDSPPQRRLFAAENAFSVAEIMASQGKNSLFVYEARSEVLKAYNETQSLKNQLKDHPFEEKISKFLSSNYIELEFRSFLEKSLYTYPEINIKTGSNRCTILSSVDCPDYTLKHIAIPPSVQFKEKDAVVVSLPIFSSEDKIIGSYIDPIRSSSKLFATNLISEKHKSVSNEIKRLFIKKESFALGNEHLRFSISGHLQKSLNKKCHLLANYLSSQPIGSFVPLEKSLSDCKSILSGALDTLNPNLLMNIGSLDEIRNSKK